MTIVFSIAGTLACVLLLVGVFHAGVRRGTVLTLNEIKQAVTVAQAQIVAIRQDQVN